VWLEIVSADTISSNPKLFLVSKGKVPKPTIAYILLSADTVSTERYLTSAKFLSRGTNKSVRFSYTADTVSSVRFLNKLSFAITIHFLPASFAGVIWPQHRLHGPATPGVGGPYLLVLLAPQSKVFGVAVQAWQVLGIWHSHTAHRFWRA